MDVCAQGMTLSQPTTPCVGYLNAPGSVRWTFVARVLCFGRYFGHAGSDSLYCDFEIGRWTCVRRDTLHEGFVGFHRQDSLDLVGEESLRNVRHAMSYSNYFK